MCFLFMFKSGAESVREECTVRMIRTDVSVAAAAAPDEAEVHSQGAVDA